jgi:hypothetical protein
MLKDPESQPQPERPLEEKRPYERPAIVWREPYEPMSFGVSCAKQPGNPGCGPGPFSG